MTLPQNFYRSEDREHQEYSDNLPGKVFEPWMISCEEMLHFRGSDGWKNGMDPTPRKAYEWQVTSMKVETIRHRNQQAFLGQGLTRARLKLNKL